MSSTIPSAYPSSSAAGMSGAGCSSGAVPAPFAQTTKMNLGAILIGCVIQNLFYGNCFFLAWRYFAKDRRGDPWWFLGAVALAWILSSLSVAITVHGLWFFVMESMFHKTARTPWTVDFFLFMNSAVATVVRLLYVCRLWKLCQSLTHLRGRALSAGVLLLTILLCCVELAGSIEISVRLLHSNGSERGDVGNTLKPIFYLIFATGLSADAILTVMMCLWLHSARTGFKRTDSIINTMIVYTIETGLFPSLVETGGMIAFIVNSNSQIFLAFYLQIGVLYLTSLLTSVGARRKVQRRIQQPISVNFSALNDDFDSSRNTGDASDSGASPSDLHVDPSAMRGHHLDLHHPASLLVIDDGAEKGMTPDVERPLEQLERELLTHSRPQAASTR